MRRTIRASLFGVAVLGALGFGGSAALADKPPCPRITIGSCPNQAKCVEKCADFGGNASQANCSDGCCYCPFII